jgi:hypothetical protein
MPRALWTSPPAPALSDPKVSYWTERMAVARGILRGPILAQMIGTVCRASQSGIPVRFIRSAGRRCRRNFKVRALDAIDWKPGVSVAGNNRNSMCTEGVMDCLGVRSGFEVAFLIANRSFQEVAVVWIVFFDYPGV